MKEGDQIKLGWCELCLNVADLWSSLEFYKKLGFTEIETDMNEGWAVLEYSNLLLALYKGHIKENIINFRGGDVFKIARELKTRGLVMEEDACVEDDGSAGASLKDPDGNLLYFNTHPGEEIEKEGQ